MARIKVLGLDLAFTHVGLVVGVMRTPAPYGIEPVEVKVIETVPDAKGKKRFTYKSEEDISRCRVISTHIIRTLAENPGIQAVAAEIPTGSQSARAAKTLGMATGIIATLADCYPTLPFVWVFPNDWHRFLFNKLNPTKKEVINWVDLNWKDFDWPKKATGVGIKKGDQEHAADAMGTLAFFMEGNLARMLKKTRKISREE